MYYYFNIKSPCKINLSLNVYDKRDDGYHDLVSIFQLVSLADSISGNTNNSGRIIVNGDFDFPVEDNLIFKAIKLFFNRASINDGITLNVQKVIPEGGGLGGGSANCGAVLRLLNKIYPNRIKPLELFDIALELGSDVPFFLNSPTALVEGRGEKITPLITHTDYYLLLVNPSVHISTKKAFEILHHKDCILENKGEDSSFMVNKYLDGKNSFTFFKNSFEIALQSDYTFINNIKKSMLTGNAIYSAMSGSGSTMFGVFDSLENAKNVEKDLCCNKQYKCFLVKPLNSFPEAEIKRI